MKRLYGAPMLAWCSRPEAPHTLNLKSFGGREDIALDARFARFFSSERSTGKPEQIRALVIPPFGKVPC